MGNLGMAHEFTGGPHQIKGRSGLARAEVLT
jgi:hypothetical protein